jgi:hypothetical protein
MILCPSVMKGASRNGLSGSGPATWPGLTTIYLSSGRRLEQGMKLLAGERLSWIPPHAPPEQATRLGVNWRIKMDTVGK